MIIHSGRLRSDGVAPEARLALDLIERRLEGHQRGHLQVREPGQRELHQPVAGALQPHIDLRRRRLALAGGQRLGPGSGPPQRGGRLRRERVVLRALQRRARGREHQEMAVDELAAPDAVEGLGEGLRERRPGERAPERVERGEVILAQAGEAAGEGVIDTVDEVCGVSDRGRRGGEIGEGHG